MITLPLTLAIFVFSGWLSYWVIKVPATIKGSSPISTFKEFLAANWKEIFLSVIGLLMVLLGGDGIPEAFGKITGPLTAYAVGGGIPSITMNFSGLLAKK